MSLDTVTKLQAALILADRHLSVLPKDLPYHKLEPKFRELGLEKRMGQYSGTCKGDDNLAIFSPHGYFEQADVLGLPDIGDQVVYILDQVRALEEEMLIGIARQ